MYDGLETAILTDEDLCSSVVSDLEVFLCPNCEHKVWVHMVENCTPIASQLLNPQSKS